MGRSWNSGGENSIARYVLEKPSLDPNDPDTDGDGFTDGEEVVLETNPNDIDDPIILPVISNFNSSRSNIDLLSSSSDFPVTITYSVTATDNVGVSIVSIPGATQVSQNGDIYTFSETFNYADYTYGSIAVTRTASVTDNAGNVATDDITLSINKIDNQSPSISLSTSRSNIDLLSSSSDFLVTITYSVTATDNVGVSIVSIPEVPRKLVKMEISIPSVKHLITMIILMGTYWATRTASVTDNANFVATDDITLSINKIDNQSPSISLSADDTTIDLRLIEQIQTITYSVTATDNVGISSVSIPGATQGGQSGDTYFFVETFNYDDYPYGNSAATRTASVTDNAGNSSSQTITITINKINNPPVFTSPNEFLILENTNYIGTLSATDPEGDEVIYNVVETNNISLSRLPESVTGILTFEILPDYEHDLTNYVCVFSASDENGASSFTTNSINIIDDRTEDIDGDGLTEVEEEDVYGTSDLLSDTDSDGLTDGGEVNTYSNGSK